MPVAATSTRSVNIREVPTQEGYDLWSSTYDSGTNPLVLLEQPMMAELLGDCAGLSVLDVGCGTGRHSLRLSRAGARVTGIDFSEGMLAQARAKAQAGMAAERSMFPTTASPRVPRFLVHDVAKTFPFEDASFDRVICALVFDHVADLNPVFAEMARVCEPGGFVVVTSMHPAVFLLGRQANFTNAAGEEIRPASSRNEVSDFVMAALGAGLRIVEMRERVATAELAALTSKAEKYLGWPLLLAMKLALPA